MSVETEVEELLQRLVDAWNRRDAGSFAGLFASDADYVTGDGEWLQGREAIGRLVLRGSSMGRASIQGSPSIRVSGGTASMVFRWRAADGPRSSSGVTSCVLSMSGNGWVIERLQNTDERAG